MSYVALEGEEDALFAACAMLGAFAAVALAVLGSLG